MTSLKKSLRIVWAVDPANQTAIFSKSIPQVLRYFLGEAETVIEPVYVLKMAPEVSGDFSTKWGPEYCAAAEDTLEKISRDLKVRDTAPPKVILHNSMSNRAAVDTLLEHASRSKADLIVAQAHSRKDARLFFLGSFAETLLFRSKIPVMLISKEMKAFRGFQNILFPTDFGTAARAQLNQVINLALAFKTRVTLFHSVQHPVEPVWTTFHQPGPLTPFSGYVQGQVDLSTRKAKSCQKTAEEQGVQLDYVIDEEGLSIWDQIVSLAKKRDIGLIAMKAQSSPISPALLGSVTRQVVRHAPCPVLVLKTKPIRALRAPMPAIETAQKAA